MPLQKKYSMQILANVFANQLSVEPASSLSDVSVFALQRNAQTIDFILINQTVRVNAHPLSAAITSISTLRTASASAPNL